MCSVVPAGAELRHVELFGTSRRVGALVRLNADLRSDSAAARRCPWQQQTAGRRDIAAPTIVSLIVTPSTRRPVFSKKQIPHRVWSSKNRMFARLGPLRTAPKTAP
ncbi:hypothetical protein EMIHUDRAFT_253235 [Emiliania huxleyi CCMP1516]|uniref:Uncharacterized protein n=2 Tax=Emiliania huxleyi TaxID=2903 RepID=A0A0D3KAY7_EMIH1|nr:hypothetical protein EMIHUDRAFT_253235 [Emiliania huxleyi CCMP1516]EOD32922.1 hypothetical protein EMIHUDRAFT_253235 [Emiliania huxleyi CCMP1516]|eukprot:XP_005785351.1 hypothetical protein EMIHUDRAFT_253235 [Emiliania huxleyi CCMP1516]